MSNYLLLRAANLVGSQSALAKKLAISNKTVNSWVNRDIRVPLNFALDIEVLSDSKFNAEDISPHVAKSLEKYKKFLKSNWHKKISNQKQNIKNLCLKNEKLIVTELKLKLPLQHAILGLLTVCDEQGLFHWDLNQLHQNIFPLREDIKLSEILDIFVSMGLVKKYYLHGKYYGCFILAENQYA